LNTDDEIRNKHIERMKVLKMNQQHTRTHIHTHTAMLENVLAKKYFNNKNNKK